VDVAVVGLGNMGKAMAKSLLAAGHRVRVWNRSPAAVEELCRYGAQPAATPQEAFSGDAFISMLADDAAIRAVVAQALPAGPVSTVHINMATISVACAKELAALHAERGVAYVAAPVLGRPDLAGAGKLHILAAGPREPIVRCEPLFQAMGQRTWRLGEDPSEANVLKLAANMMLACAIEAIAEGVALVAAHAIPAADLIELLTHTFFSAPAYQVYGDLILRQHYEPAGFKLALGLKDIRLALSAGEAARVPLPFASILRDNLIDAIAHGDGTKDWSAVAEVVARRASLADR
jgi:3-hydroxyisobutyrate dehydrogenase-like beta-hydroxyacid dehydrogenase